VSTVCIVFVSFYALIYFMYLFMTVGVCTYLLRCIDSELHSSVVHTRECDNRVYCVGCVKHCDYAWSDSFYVVHLGNGQ